MAEERGKESVQGGVNDLTVLLTLSLWQFSYTIQFGRQAAQTTMCTIAIQAMSLYFNPLWLLLQMRIFPSFSLLLQSKKELYFNIGWCIEFWGVQYTKVPRAQGRRVPLLANSSSYQSPRDPPNECDSELEQLLLLPQS